MNSHFIHIFVETTLENMKEISMSTYQEMRNAEWDMAVKNNLVEDTNDNWENFDESYYEYLLWEKGYTIVD
tara:strand:- start:915 stop:1127 length:213 start_codon:yes stop_codon:yes gene_type:complete